MNQTELLLEYLKEQYTQSRQHETRQTNATTFLTAAAGVTLGYVLKDGNLRADTWWVGVIVALIGLANYLINRAHYQGNRFHTSIAGETRRTLEQAIGNWTVQCPTQIRQAIINKQGLGRHESVGLKVQAALQLVPVGVMVTGIAIAILSLYRVIPPLTS